MPINPVDPISTLATGVPLATDLTPATDTQDISQAAAGTTKKYTRASEFNYYFGAAGIETIEPVQLGTVANLNSTYNNGTFGVGATLTNNGSLGILIIDGVNVTLGYRILVWNQSNQEENGIYEVTTVGTSLVPWVLTRATDYNNPAQVIEGQIVLVELGTTLANRAFQETAAGPFIIGTTGIVFEQFDILNSAFVTFPTWIIAAGASTNLSPGNSYVAANTGSTNTFVLPTIAIAGTTIDIAMGSALAWTISQNAGQSIRVGNITSTIGAGGSWSSSDVGDSVSLVCTVANTSWSAYAVVGNLNYV